MIALSPIALPGRGRKARLLTVVALVACFTLPPRAATTAGVYAMATEKMTLNLLLARVRETSQVPIRMGFKQDVDVRSLLGRWRFSTTVRRNGSDVEVEVEGAPRFIPPDLLADLADFEKALANFQLEYVGKDSRGYHEVKGVRRPECCTGAIEGLLLIHPNTYLIEHTEARYSWGKVRVEHTYTSVGEVKVLKRQEATISPFAARLTIVYRDYWVEQ